MSMTNTIKTLKLPFSFETVEVKEKISAYVPNDMIPSFKVITEDYTNVTALEDFGHTIKKGDTFSRVVIYPQSRTIRTDTSRFKNNPITQNYDVNGNPIDRSNTIIDVASFEELAWAVDTFGWFFSYLPKKEDDDWNREHYCQKFRVANKWLIDGGQGDYGDFHATLLEGEDIQYDYGKKFKPEYATPGINLWKKGECEIFMYTNYFTDCVLE